MNCRDSLIQALESGDYPKTIGRLRRMSWDESRYGYCAWGVAIDVAIKMDPHIGLSWDGEYVVVKDGKRLSSIPPTFITTMFGEPADHAEILASVSDYDRNDNHARAIAYLKGEKTWGQIMTERGF